MAVAKSPLTFAISHVPTSAQRNPVSSVQSLSTRASLQRVGTGVRVAYAQLTSDPQGDCGPRVSLLWRGFTAACALFFFKRKRKPENDKKLT